MSDTTWRKEILEEMAEHGDAWENILSVLLPQPDDIIDDEVRERFCTMPPNAKRWFNVEFDAGFGKVEAIPFTIWTKDRVYFSLEYDGTQWCGSLPLNPYFYGSEKPKNLGGGKPFRTKRG